MSVTSDQIDAGLAAQDTLTTERGRPGLRPPGPERIYLAGPMTGLPEYNYPAFHAATARLRGCGYHVENPAETVEQASWTGYMRHAVAKLVTCDRVMTLPGWADSRGAQTEVALAHALGMPVQPVIVSTQPEGADHG